MTPEAVAAVFREEAARLGFHRIGFAPVEPWERHAHYRAWVAAGYAGEMEYLVTGAEERRDVRALFEGARTVVTVALSYAHEESPRPPDSLVRGRMARYARGADYHMVLKGRLTKLAEAVGARLGRPLGYRACVDTAPVLEHEAAQAGGLGFIAKNSLLIAPGLGSYVLLGELLVDLEATPGTQEAPRCGHCRACLDACPTGAFVDAYVLDARRCISYLTIERRGPIPRALRPLIGDWVFGCDICQEVCPFNAGSGAQHGGDPALRPAYADRAHPPLVQLLEMGAARYRKYVARTALRRISRAQLLRNVAVALGNVGGPAEVAALVRAFDREQAQPLVRAHLAWALGRVAVRHGYAPARAALAERLVGERDVEVREELALALAESEAAMSSGPPATPSR
jgi:epoxyqueuosine reductase